MSNSPDRTRGVVNFAEWREKRAAEASVTVEVTDDFKVVIPPPEQWPAAAKNVRTKLPDQLRLIIGDETYERFRDLVADGDDSAAEMMWAIYKDAFKEMQGVPLGESSAS